jgi:hypothetical protein
MEEYELDCAIVDTKWTFGFHIIQGISRRLAEQLVGREEGLSSVALFS